MSDTVREPLRIGVLGAARITERALIDPARRGGHRLVAVAARDRSRAEAFAAAHGVQRVAHSYADLLADPEVEVVYNPLANGLHGPWNSAALAAGKHVLSEKPSASNAEEAAEVREAAAKAARSSLRRSTTSSTRSPAVCTSSSKAVNWATCGGWRRRSRYRPPRTPTRAGPCRSPAAP